MSELSLDAIGRKHKTDKASNFHNYLVFYETFFAPLRHEPLKMLEIGVFGGASINTWAEYFPQAEIIGVDIVPTSKRFERPRVTIELLDQSNIEELTRVAVKHGPFDLIIEDGSHMWEHQVTTLKTLFPFLKNNGLYIVEDLQTNYGPLAERYQGFASTSCVEFLKRWLDLRVADNQIRINEIEDPFLRTYGRAVDFLTFYRRACLIKKQVPVIIRESNAGEPLLDLRGTDLLAPVKLVAHLGNVGDVFCPRGFINLGSDSYILQGLSIDCEGAPLEYRVRSAEGGWSEWIGNGIYIGTRGEAKSLTGIAVRLRADMRERFSVRLAGRFAGSSVLREAVDGEDCLAPTEAELCGLHILVTPRLA